MAGLMAGAEPRRWQAWSCAVGVFAGDSGLSVRWVPAESWFLVEGARRGPRCGSTWAETSGRASRADEPDTKATLMVDTPRFPCFKPFPAAERCP